MQRLEDLLVIVKSCTTEELMKNIPDILASMKRFPVEDLDRALSAIDPSRQAPTVAMILCTKAGNPNCPLETLLQQTETFLNGVSSSGNMMRNFDVHQICILMRHVFERLVRDRATHLGLALFKFAINVIQDNPRQLTEIHGLFLQLCLESKNLKPASDLLLTDVYEVNPNRNCDAQGHLQYFFYGSVVLASYGFFISALRCIEMVFYVPNATSVSNSLVTEAYKKYLLLVLLSKNRAASLPRSVTGQLENHLRKAVEPYAALNSLFLADTLDVAAMDAIAQQHQRVFTTDKNYGLVKHCIRRYRVRELIKYAKAFENVEITDLMTTLQVPNLETLELLLLDMSTCSGFMGLLDQASNVVIFRKKTDVVLPDQAVISLQHELSAMQKVVEAVWNVEKELVVDPEFLKKALQGESGARDDYIMGLMDAPTISSANGFGLGMARAGRRTP